MHLKRLTFEDSYEGKRNHELNGNRNKQSCQVRFTYLTICFFPSFFSYLVQVCLSSYILFIVSDASFHRSFSYNQFQLLQSSTRNARCDSCLSCSFKVCFDGASLVYIWLCRSFIGHWPTRILKVGSSQDTARHSALVRKHRKNPLLAMPCDQIR